MSPFHFLSKEKSLIIIILLRLLIIIDNNKKYLYTKNNFSLIILIILLTNVLSIIPYRYCFSSYLWNNLMVSLVLVISLIVFYLISNFNKYSSHFLPINSPTMLWDMLITLEIIRNLIRPLTLSLRLTCNLLTGHVLIGLITQRNLLVLVPLIFFELGVSVIQSHVYSMLIYSYLS